MSMKVLGSHSQSVVSLTHLTSTLQTVVLGSIQSMVVKALVSSGIFIINKTIETWLRTRQNK